MPIPVPALKGGKLASSPSGAKLVLYLPGAKPPPTLPVLDLESGTWTEVSEPGVAAWEPVGG